MGDDDAPLARAAEETPRRLNSRQSLLLADLVPANLSVFCDVTFGPFFFGADLERGCAKPDRVAA